MKTILQLIKAVLLCLLFLLVFLAGSFADVLHIHLFVTRPTPGTVRYFVGGGLVLMAALWMLVALFQAVRKKAVLWSLLPFALALLLGLMAKFGWVERPL